MILCLSHSVQQYVINCWDFSGFREKTQEWVFQYFYQIHNDQTTQHKLFDFIKNCIRPFS